MILFLVFSATKTSMPRQLCCQNYVLQIENLREYNLAKMFAHISKAKAEEIETSCALVKVSSVLLQTSDFVVFLKN